MPRLFDETRGFAAPITPERSECRLADVWREAWELLAPQRVGRDARLHEPRDANELRLSIDRFRMVQVFRNVLENALAACSDPVHITIALHPLQLAGQPAVRVVVRDNGPGMTPQQRERVFEAFFTTKPKGTGLGMPIAQRIVEAHGGRIDIASRRHAPRHGVAHGMDTPVDALGAEVILDLPREAPP